MISERPMRFPVRTILALALGFAPLASQIEAQPPLLEVQVPGGVERGLPIHWTDGEALLLRTDGSIRHLQGEETRKHQALSQSFAPLTAIQLRATLSQELGRDVDIQTTASYLVATSKGDAELWGQKFTQLQAGFLRFFSTRGWPLPAADFPLIAIVWPSGEAFQRQAAQQGIRLGDQTLGYYSSMDNRMHLFQQRHSRPQWFDTDKVILHEATHQLAYNMGVHQRLSDTPLWVVEGLASLFESPAFAIGPDRGPLPERINQARFQTWKAMANDPKKLLSELESLIRTDKLFQQNPDHAYAMSWAISFYLAERDGSRFMKWLQHLSKLQPLREYSEGARLADFRQLVAADPSLLLGKVDRFLNDPALSE